MESWQNVTSRPVERRHPPELMERAVLLVHRAP